MAANKDLQEMLITWIKTNNVFECDPNFRLSTLSLPNNAIENISTYRRGVARY